MKDIVIVKVYNSLQKVYKKFTKCLQTNIYDLQNLRVVLFYSTFVVAIGLQRVVR